MGFLNSTVSSVSITETIGEIYKKRIFVKFSMIPVIDCWFFFIGFRICHEKAWRKDFRPATLNGNAVERFHFFRLLNSIIPLGLANILLKQLNSITFFLLISIAGLFWTIYYPSNCHSYCKMAHIWYSHAPRPPSPPRPPGGATRPPGGAPRPPGGAPRPPGLI